MALRYENGQISLLDQTLLPREERWLLVNNPTEMVAHIQRLAVRGAPLIGVAAALSLAHYAGKGASKQECHVALESLRESRPTAVNLMHAMDRMRPALEAANFASLLEEKAMEIFQEDVQLCERMAERVASHIQSGDTILTHCNTGGLATAGVGTALGGIRRAFEQGKKIHVYVDETRPLMQGARLTAWELEKLGIPYTLICDNMAASLFQAKKIQKVFVGADRIAANGDSANKIGTYGVAVLAKFHQVPFYIVAPETTCDPKCASAAEIPIEERNAAEVRGTNSPQNAPVWNPAFDITPRALITKILLDSGER